MRSQDRTQPFTSSEVPAENRGHFRFLLSISVWPRKCNRVGSEIRMTKLRILPLLLLLSSFARVNGQPLHDDAAIRRQLTGYAEARTQGSGDKQASFYAEDGDEWELFAPEKTDGRSAIAKLLDLPPEPDRRFRLEILHITPLGRDAALVDAHWYRETSPRPKGRVHYLMVKEKGTWLIRSARINPYPPPKP